VIRTSLVRRPAALVLTAALAAAAPCRAGAQSLDTVLQWNRVMLERIAAPGANPPTVFVHRPMAMSSVAMFDAANSFDRTYQPSVTWEAAAAGASRDAAVAQAAHDVLVELLPTQRAALDAALAATLAGIPPQAARDGALVGAAVARAVIEDRRDDGWARVPPPYLLPSLAGFWRPTPPANAAATFTHYPDVRGFVVDSGRRFLVEPPPALTSARYAADFNDAKRLGSATSTARTAEQTQMARLWHGVGTTTTSPALWNVVLADVARARGWSGLDAARAFALLNMTQHDALLTAFTGKYLYGLWRPVTAIREADTDGNPATDADPAWTSLLPSPPYPTYPGNRACLGSSQSRLLARLVGQDDVPLDVTWRLVDGTAVTRQYSGFRQLSDEEAKSRIWGGIHFEFDTLASTGVCTELADYAADNLLRRQ
jgi:hypothetical protein